MHTVYCCICKLPSIDGMFLWHFSFHNKIESVLEWLHYNHTQIHQLQNKEIIFGVCSRALPEQAEAGTDCWEGKIFLSQHLAWVKTDVGVSGSRLNAGSLRKLLHIKQLQSHTSLCQYGLSLNLEDLMTCLQNSDLPTLGFWAHISQLKITGRIAFTILLPSRFQQNVTHHVTAGNLLKQQLQWDFIMSKLRKTV